MLEPKFKIGDVVYLHSNSKSDSCFMKNSIEQVIIGSDYIYYNLENKARSHYRCVEEKNLFLDLESCKNNHKNNILMGLQKIKLIDLTEFTISEEERAHNK